VASAAARAFFEALPFRCSSDGLGFRTAADLAAHKEVLQDRARRRSAASAQAKGTSAARSRDWAPRAESWAADALTPAAAPSSGAGPDGAAKVSTGPGAGGKGAGAAKAPSVAAGASGGATGAGGGDAVVSDGTALQCRLCGVAFETAYDDAREVWLYKGAVQVPVTHDGGGSGGSGSGGGGGGQGMTTVVLHATCAGDVTTGGSPVRSSLLLDPTEA
jgi:hypothetical protein